MAGYNKANEKIRGLREALRDICNDNPQYEPLWAKYIETANDASSRTNLSPANFPNYTRHDTKHSRAVLSKMEMLIGEERLHALGPTDIWLLLMCAYTHDYGMVISISDITQHLLNGKLQEHYDHLKDGKHSEYTKAANELDFNELKSKIEALATNAKKTVKSHSVAKGKIAVLQHELLNGLLAQRNIMLLLQSYFRNSHACGYRLSLANNVNDSIDSRLHNLVASINEAHTKSWAAVMALSDKTDGFATDHAHPRFAAVMLRLADLLDIDASRVNPYQVHLTINTNESMAHQERSLAVESVLTNPKNVGAHFHFKSHAIEERYNEYGNGSLLSSMHGSFYMEDDVFTIRYNAARLAFDWYEILKEELKNFSLHWNDIVCPGYGGSAPQIRDEDFSVKIDHEIMTTDDLDLRYELSNKRAYEIIRGAGIYNDKLTFIRELLQNANDATKIQMFIDWEKYNSTDCPQDSKKLTPEKFFMQLPYDIKSKTIIITIEDIPGPENGEMHCEIKIEDFGTGISREKLKKLKYVGNIYDSETERVERAMPEWLRPTGSFGIGLQSVFQFTKRFRMKTHATATNEDFIIMFNALETDCVIFPQKAIGNNRRKIGGTTVMVPLDLLQDTFEKMDVYTDVDYFTDKTEIVWKIIKKYITSIGGADIVPIVLQRKKAGQAMPSEIITMNNIYETAFPEVFNEIRNQRNWMNQSFNGTSMELQPRFKFRAERYNDETGDYKFWYWSDENNILAEVFLESQRKHDERKVRDGYTYDREITLEGTGDFTYRGITVGPSDPDKFFQYSWEKISTAWCDARFYVQFGEADQILRINRDKLLDNSDTVKSMKNKTQLVLLEVFDEILSFYQQNKEFSEHVRTRVSCLVRLAMAADCLIKRTIKQPNEHTELLHIDSTDSARLIEIKNDLLLKINGLQEKTIAYFYDKGNHVCIESKEKPFGDSLSNTTDIWFCNDTLAIEPSINMGAEGAAEDIITVYPDTTLSYPIKSYWSEVLFHERIERGYTHLIPIYKYCVLPRRVISISDRDKKLLIQHSYSILKHQANESNGQRNRLVADSHLFVGARHIFPSFDKSFKIITVPYDASVFNENCKKYGYMVISPFINAMFQKKENGKCLMDCLISKYRKSALTNDYTAFETYTLHKLCADEQSSCDEYGFRALISYVMENSTDYSAHLSREDYLNDYMAFIRYYLKHAI